MRLVPYDVRKIAGRGAYTKSGNLIFLEEFAQSGLECAKVEDYPQKDANSCVSSLKNSIKLYKMHGIQAMVRNGEVFLINKLAKKD